jgi:SAM-dependent methyltransferase
VRRLATDWRMKAAIQAAFSRVPHGARLNLLLQRATGGLPLSDAKVQVSLELCVHHRTMLELYGATPIDSAEFFEFGAGWDMHVPLLLSGLGVGSQTVIDIRRLISPQLTVQMAERLHFIDPPPERWNPPLTTPREVDDLLAANRIRYLAPLDARATGFPDASKDYITSTNTLEHIPPDDIAAILSECHRILRPDGLLSFQIDYRDHYSYFDPSITVYHFLQFPERSWRWINSSLHYQNRLRHRDHLALIERAGLEVVHEQLEPGTEADLDVLEQMPVDPAFSGYTREELAIRGSRLVLRKK